MGIGFDVHHRETIAQALAEQAGITDPEKQERFIDYIDRTATIGAFGAGSLLTYSHLQNGDQTTKQELLDDFPSFNNDEATATTPAVLKGFERDFVCFDIFYRGTEDAPGITLGLEANPDGQTNGGVVNTSLDGMPPEMAAAFVVKYLELFRDREFPPNMPIYTFDVTEVTDETGVTSMCLACVADQEGDLYIHNVNNRYAKGDPNSPYYFEKGDVQTRANHISAAYGPTHVPGTDQEKAPGKVTNLDYWRDLIADSMDKKIPVEPHMMELYTAAVCARMGMDEQQRLQLEALERDGVSSNKLSALPVFAAAVVASNQAALVPDAELDGEHLENA